MGADPDVMLNNSIQQLEYEISSAIKKATLTHPKTIAFIQGHGELPLPQVRDISNSLEEFYIVKDVNIDGQLNALDGLSAIILAGPDSAVSEKDKFIIDQFIMNGGKVLWFVENAQINSDSLRKNGISMGLAVNNNLSDLLFKYGARVNSDFIMDMQALPIPVVTGMVGDQPKQELFPWYYFPLIFSTEEHPITAHIDAIASQYASSIDTVGGKGIRKTPLLFSSKYSKVTNAPTRVSLNILREIPNEKRFNKGNRMVAVLLEGEFESVFNGRITEDISTNPDFNFKTKSPKNKMIVVSDADIIRNDLSPNGEEFMELGYYRFTQRVYGNKDFVLNAMNYLLEEDGLIFSRIKEFKLRLLNRQKVTKEKEKWQILNTALPIVLIVLIGFVIGFLRKRRYTTH
jgi:gliding-associated putative ABC transporter substrate-binding component GldG